MPRTRPFHGRYRGSNPRGDATLSPDAGALWRREWQAEHDSLKKMQNSNTNADSCVSIRFPANGGLAQLGERLHGMQEVSGSIPLSSTRSRSLSSRCLGHDPFTVGTGVRIPVGTPISKPVRLAPVGLLVFMCGAVRTNIKKAPACLSGAFGDPVRPFRYGRRSFH